MPCTSAFCHPDTLKRKIRSTVHKSYGVILLTKNGTQGPILRLLLHTCSFYHELHELHEFLAARCYQLLRDLS